MKVTVIGPNLLKQDKGQFHVHAAGCRDISADPQRNGYRQAAPHMEVDAESRLDVAGFVYEDHMNEAEEGTPWTEPEAYLSDFHFAPCCDELPDVEPETKIAAPEGWRIERVEHRTHATYEVYEDGGSTWGSGEPRPELEVTLWFADPDVTGPFGRREPEVSWPSTSDRRPALAVALAAALTAAAEEAKS